MKLRKMADGLAMENGQTAQQIVVVEEKRGLDPVPTRPLQMEELIVLEKL